MNFYKNIVEYKGKLFVRGILEGQEFQEKVDFSPTFFTLTNKESKHKNLQGQYLQPTVFQSIAKAREFRKTYDNSNSPIYGMERFAYQYISNEYRDDIDWQKDKIKIFTIDIETSCENGFPDIDNPIEELLCLTVKNQTNKQILTWGTGDFVTDREDVTYVKCDSEKELIKEFMSFWMKNYPDIITGWNCKFFDIPYLLGRISRLTDNKVIRKLSPWGLVEKKEVIVRGRPKTVFSIMGIAMLDYIDLYQKFIPVSQESYKLDYIGKVELGIGKDEMPYETFREWYTNDFQSFVDYNIQDVEIVDRLEDKLKLIELILTMAYEAKVNYDDVFSQVRVWDVLIYNYLRKEHIVVPEKSEQVKDSKYDGAYVKEPMTGMHDWIVSFDINSLYPHLIMQYNISPEKIVGMNPEGTSVNKLLSRKLNLDHLKGQDVCMTPNGATFKRDNAGFLPRLLDEMYQDRVVYKKKMMEAKKLHQKTGDDKYKNEIARCHNIQWAKKIALNSAYGAIGNQYFRYYDVRQATAITSSGQLVIRHIEAEVNNYMNKILQTKNVDYIVASDTDSIYLKLDSLVEKTCKDKTIDQKVNFIDKVAQQKIEPFIEKCFNDLADYTNAFKQRMVMKREVIADKAIWTAKKRYMLHVLDDEGIRLTKPKMKIMGIEAVKSSTPEVCRGRIKTAIDMMMTEDNDTLIKFVADFREEFNKMTPEQISFPRSCNNLKKYKSSSQIFIKGTPIHVKGALIYNLKIKELKIDHIYPAIQEGDKVKFIKLKQRNPFKHDVISYMTKLPREFELDEYIDRDLMFEKTFIAPLSFILEAIGWEIEKKASLEAFF